MKKLITRLTAIALTFCIMMSWMLSIITSASEESDPSYAVADHFSNLKDVGSSGSVPSTAHVPLNELGSCSYVAMSMLLSFYDTYWDDDFIVEPLDWDRGVFDSSTNTLITTFSTNSEFDAWKDWKETYPNSSFIDFELANQATYFQEYLISLGRFADYHTNIEENGYGLSTRKSINLLKNYLYNVRGFTEEQVEVCYAVECIFGVSQNELNQIVSDQISSGFPVIYRGVKFDTEIEIDSLDDVLDIPIGHLMIAYASEDTNNDGNSDVIYLHNGHNVTNTFTTIADTEYQYFNVAIWLDINEELFTHDCSDNYEDIATGSNVCGCNVYYDIHPSHTHFYYDSYSLIDHFGECICGNITNSAPHDYKYSDVTSSTHHQKCRGCNYETTTNHYYNTFSSSLNGHIAECDCGASKEESHYDNNYVIQNESRHAIYCICGQFIRTSPHQMTSTGIKNICRDCGFVGAGGLLPPGQIIAGVETETDTE